MEDASDGLRDTGAPIGWARAAATVLLLSLVGAGLLVYLPEFLLTRATALSHSARSAVATGAFFVLLGALAWALRRLQHRRLL